ncbi:MAG: NYN domain-containing protein [Nitrospirae bacterium]|nr:NYN domain-containing protein [Nitrospirota bacterium]
MKIYSFIDSQNLNLSVQSAGWKIDFTKFRVYLMEKYKVDKAFLFLGYVAGNEEMYTALQEAGYILVFRPTLKYKNGKIKGNCDAELVLHCMIEKNNFDKAIIITGDGDFHCLVEYLKNEKKLHKIGIPNSKAFSALLRKFSSYFFYINKLRDKLELKREV